MKTYELWTHPRTGDVYAFRLEDGRVTGCRGPLSTHERSEGDLAAFSYEDLPEPIRRVGESLEPFTRIGDWLLKEQIKPRGSRPGNALSRALGRVAARRRVRH